MELLGEPSVVLEQSVVASTPIAPRKQRVVAFTPPSIQADMDMQLLGNSPVGADKVAARKGSKKLAKPKTRTLPAEIPGEDRRQPQDAEAMAPNKHTHNTFLSVLCLHYVPLSLGSYGNLISLSCKLCLKL